MAKPSKAAKEKAAENPAAPQAQAGKEAGAPPASAVETASIEGLMQRPNVRAFFEKHAEEANRVLRLGPNGTGWQFNESKRDDAVALARVLNHLVGDLPE